MRVHPAYAAVLVLASALPACRGAGSTAIDRNSSGPERGGETLLADTVKGSHVGTDPGHAGDGTALTPKPGNELAAFAAGCFWGVEDNFRQVPGVVATAVGYTGGHTDHPTYRSVCTHTTGHAETVVVEFDPKKVTYATLLNVFFKNHDPTTVNRQGPDEGDQYRSAIFTFNDAQAAAANAAKDKETKAIHRTVVTIIEPLARFWKAEEYHQQYDEKSGTHSCPTPRGLPDQGT
jgi:peptide-methionine (S)-S-oxide reductase